MAVDETSLINQHILSEVADDILRRAGIGLPSYSFDDVYAKLSSLLPCQQSSLRFDLSLLQTQSSAPMFSQHNNTGLEYHLTLVDGKITSAVVLQDGHAHTICNIQASEDVLQQMQSDQRKPFLCQRR